MSAKNKPANKAARRSQRMVKKAAAERIRQQIRAERIEDDDVGELATITSMIGRQRKTA